MKTHKKKTYLSILHLIFVGHDVLFVARTSGGATIAILRLRYETDVTSTSKRQCIVFIHMGASLHRRPKQQSQFLATQHYFS